MLTVGLTVLVGLVLGWVWPPIQNSISQFGQFVMDSQFGPAFYAAGKRLLIPAGLHHVYYPSFLYQFGDFTTAAGQVVHGDSARYFAGDRTAGIFMASEFPIMLFGLPAAALAMTLRAPKNKRKAVAGIMISAALTSIITGITEPIEFAFIFVAPLLFVFHVGAAFLSGILTKLFNVHLGYTFSASLIDYGLGYFNQQNSSYFWLLIGPVMALTYFGAFYWLIGVFNFKTPGRELDTESRVDEEKFNLSQKPAMVLEALGGSENIVNIDACITRLRLQLKDATKLDEAQLKKLGAVGIFRAGGSSVQAVFGVESEHLKEEIKKHLASTNQNIKSKIGSPIRGKVVSLSDVPD
ncbi:MAG: PTS transporter subunit EIIC, partial [Candidatus Paceibacterales bacterium]